MKKSCFLISYKGLYNSAGYLETDMFKLAKEDGFDAVEPLVAHELAKDNAIEDAKKIAERIKANDLDCSCLSYAINMLDMSKEEAVAKLKRAVDIAITLGSPFLHHTFQVSLRPKEVDLYHKFHKTFVEIARETALYAGEKGIECIYEDQGYYMNNPELFSELMNDIGLENTGVCLDVGNALFGRTSPETWTNLFAKQIKHVHIKDYLKKSAQTAPAGWFKTIEGDFLRGTIIGHGVVNFESVFASLIEFGYDGYLSLEYEGIEDWAHGVKESVKNIDYYWKRAELKKDFI